MVAAESARMVQDINRRVGEMKEACKGLDEATAATAPAGRWSPKEILSHLLGPEGTGMTATVRPFLEKDTPLIEIEAENPHYTDRRRRMTLSELLATFEKEYGGIAAIVGRLSDAELSRKAHVPLLKETELSEYPTLAQWIDGLIGYHLAFHIDHMKEIRQALGKK